MEPVNKLMRIKLHVLLSLSVCFFSCLPWHASIAMPMASHLDQRIVGDYQTFFQKQPLVGLGAYLLGSFSMAHSGIDQHLQDHWQETWHSKNQRFVRSKALVRHEGTLLIPAYLGCALWDNISGSPTPSRVAKFGQNSLRIMALGAPLQILLTRAIGSSRPVDHAPDWHPFQGRRGVSGHAFYGAVPFLALSMLFDDPLPKMGFLALSALPGLARINDDKHYPSQVLMGYGLALHIATHLIEQDGKDKKHNIHIDVIPHKDGAVLRLERSF